MNEKSYQIIYHRSIAIFKNTWDCTITSRGKHSPVIKTNIYWEVENKIDSLKKVFYEKFVVVSGDGSSQNKTQYITTLQSGNFTVTISGNKLRCTFLL